MPAYNEEKLIAESVASFFLFWEKQPNYTAKLIVVDDGSTDRTSKIVLDVQNKYENLQLISQKNQGKGAAVRSGILAAKNSDYVYFTDADMPFALKDHFKLIKTAEAGGHKIVYAQRKETEELKNNVSIIRKISSKSLRTLNRVLLGVTIRDNQCGLKLFEHKTAKYLFKHNPINGFGFDLCLSAVAKKLGHTIHTVEVEFLEERRESTVNVFKTSTQMLKDIYSIRRLTRTLD